MSKPISFVRLIWTIIGIILSVQESIGSSLQAPDDKRYANVTDSIIDHAFKFYKKHQRPSWNGMDATKVIVYMDILSITKVDVINMEYTSDMLLRQIWIDPRLAWDNLPEFSWYKVPIAIPAKIKYVWLPDLFFRNGKQGYLHEMTTPNYLLRLNPNGEILYSQKITMRFACQMKLQTFPMDTQKCLMNIGSYGYTTKDVVFEWRSDDIPVKGAVDMRLSEFNRPEKYHTRDCSQGTSTGAYTCLENSFILKRQLGSYIASTYIPSVLIILVSWLNFWVSVDAVPARVTLGLLSLLGILTQGTSLASNLPRVSYIKAIDIWMIACIMFVIGALIEFAVASIHARGRKRETWKSEIRKIVRQELQRVVCDLSPQPGIGSSNTGIQDASESHTHSPRNSFPLVQLNRSCNAMTTSHYPVQTSTGIKDCDIVTYNPNNMYNNQQYGITTMNSTPDTLIMDGTGGPVRMPMSNSQHTNKFNTYNDELEELLTNAVDKGAKNSGAAQPSPQNATSTGSAVDAYSRFIFPASFLLFNCFYWMYYLVIVNRLDE